MLYQNTMQGSRLFGSDSPVLGVICLCFYFNVCLAQTIHVQLTPLQIPGPFQILEQI